MVKTEEWLEVVPPLPEAEAVQRFREWKAFQAEQGRNLYPEQIRRDLVLNGPGQGCIVRFLVKLV